MKEQYIIQKSEYLREEKLNKLFEYYKKFHKLEYKKRNITLNTDLKRNDIISLIPINMCIKSELGIDDLTHKFIIEWKKKKESDYYVYINSLPKYLNNFPIFWTQKQKNIIRETEFYKSLINHENNMLMLYNIKFKDVISLDNFLWARSIVSSRNFKIYINNISYNILVPIADMLDHSPEPNCNWGYDKNTNSFIVRSSDNLQNGISIYDSYGNKNAHTFLLYYGFYPEYNRDMYIDNKKQYSTTIEQDKENKKKSMDINTKTAYDVLINEKLHIA